MVAEVRAIGEVLLQRLHQVVDGHPDLLHVCLLVLEGEVAPAGVTQPPVPSSLVMTALPSD